MKTQAARVRTLATGALALMALALAPAAPAVTNLYTESFNSGTDNGSLTPVGWSGANSWNQAIQGGAVPPEGDTWYAGKANIGNSGRIAVLSNVGEYTLTAANRIGTQFKADWASSTALGMRFVAKIGSTWYATQKYGTGTTDHGAAGPGTATTLPVTTWVSNLTVNLETDNWYAWPGTWEEAGLSSTPLTGLPPGDITQFGVWWNNQNNGHLWAVDNFRITALPAGETYVWDGGVGNWTNANWTYGGSSGQTPATGYHMFIDTNAGSTVAVAADFSSAITVNVGQNNAAALTVNGSQTLGVTDKVNLGPSGTLQVDGTLTSPGVISYGTVVVSDTGIVNATNSVQIAGGSLTCSSNGALNVGAGHLLLSGGTGATFVGPLSITGGRVTLNSGTLTYNNATTSTPAVLVFAGGALAGAGSVIPTNRYEAYNVTVTNNLTGATASLVAGSGIVTLTGSNNYGGNTTIKAHIAETTLRVADVSDIPGDGYLFFDCPGLFQNRARNRPATLETKGTLSRTIGTGTKGFLIAPRQDEESAACFSARGGPLDIQFNVGAVIDWEDNATGFARADILFNSANADNVVTLNNPLNMGTRARRLRVYENTGSTNDYAVITGCISSGSAVQLAKDGDGRLVLSGTNTYTGETYIEAGTLEIGGAGQLGAGNHAGNITIADGKTFKYNSSTNQVLRGVVGPAVAGIVIKDGAGTLTLSGTNIYTGTTTVNGGTLNLSTNGSLGATAVTVSANTNQPVLKISGNYTIGTASAGTVTVSGGVSGSQGVLSMVDGTINTLTLTNNANTDVFTIGGTSASENSILNMEVGVTSDKIVVGGGTNAKAKLLASGKKTVVNITGLGNLSGTNSTVNVSDFFSWMNKSQPTLGFTLDTGGVTTFKFNTHGNDSNVDGNVPDPVTINVSGIATYAAGAKPMGDVITLVQDMNSDLYHPAAWPDAVLVDGGIGWVSRISNGVKLTILPSGPSVWEGGTFDWNTAHWNVGGTANQLPGTGAMTVDVAGSVVTVASNANCAVLVIGQNNTSTVNINATKTLTVDNVVTVGTNGTLNVNGDLSAAAATLNSAGITDFDPASGGTIGTINVTAGTTTLDGSATFGTVNLTGGTLASGSPLALDTLSVNGGALNVSGTITASTKFSFEPVLIVTNILAGAAYAVIGESNTKDGLVTLTGINTYDGKTSIRRGVLRAGEGVGLPTDSALEFNGPGTNAAVLETAGTFARAIGTAAGNVTWTTNGGFAAYGGKLTVNLNSGATIDWSAAGGFNSKILMLGSTTADNEVEIANPINLANAARTVQVNDNTAGTNDFATLSGMISSTTPASGALTKTGAGMLVLSGTNTYSGATTVSAGTLTVGGAGQLGSGNYSNTITLSGGALFKYDSSAAQTLAGIISGAGGALTKSGAGTLTLSGTNTYTGATTVNGGTLNLSTNGSLGATAVTVSANTNQPVLKISGNYTIGTASAGTVTVSGGVSGSQGTLSLVDGTINTLTLTNNANADVFTIGGTNASENSILNMEVGVTSDLIVVGGGTSKARLLASGKKTVVNITGLGNLSGTKQTLIHAPGGVVGASFANAFELGTVSGNLGGCTVTLTSDDYNLYLVETWTSGTVLIVR